MALLALIVSCVAIFQTSRSLRAQREHNYLSVRALPSILRLNFENRIGVILENRGLGPMIVTRMEVTSGDISDTVWTSLVDAMPPIDQPWSNYIRGLGGAVLQPGKAMELLLLEGQLTDPIFTRNRDLVRSALAQLSIRIVYKDLYEREFSMAESLSSFRRE